MLNEACSPSSLHIKQADIRTELIDNNFLYSTKLTELQNHREAETAKTCFYQQYMTDFWNGLCDPKKKHGHVTSFVSWQFNFLSLNFHH